MATILSHALAAGSFYKIFPISKNKKTLRFCLIGSILPDLDVIGFSFGIRYQDMLGHRGFSHSFVFGLLYAFICLFFYLDSSKKDKIKLFILFFISIMSHALFDMLTNGGLGVGLLIPFTAERFFFPFTPLEVSPIGAHFFSHRGLIVILNELIYIGIPAFLILLLSRFKRKR